MATNGYVIIIDMIPPPAPVRRSTGQNEILSFQDITKLPESACAKLSDMALVCKKESKKKKNAGKKGNEWILGRTKHK